MRLNWQTDDDDRYSSTAIYGEFTLRVSRIATGRYWWAVYVGDDIVSAAQTHVRQMQAAKAKTIEIMQKYMLCKPQSTSRQLTLETPQTTHATPVSTGL